jgi:hypothetical protein
MDYLIKNRRMKKQGEVSQEIPRVSRLANGAGALPGKQRGGRKRKRQNLFLREVLPSLFKWRRRESNSDPKADHAGIYMLSRFSFSSFARSRVSEATKTSTES